MAEVHQAEVGQHEKFHKVGHHPHRKWPPKQTILPPSLICLRRKVPIFIPQAVVNGETKQPRGSMHPMVFDASLQIPLSPIAFKKFTKQRVRMCNIAWSLAKPCMA